MAVILVAELRAEAEAVVVAEGAEVEDAAVSSWRKRTQERPARPFFYFPVCTGKKSRDHTLDKE